MSRPTRELRVGWKFDGWGALDVGNDRWRGWQCQCTVVVINFDGCEGLSEELLRKPGRWLVYSATAWRWRWYESWKSNITSSSFRWISSATKTPAISITGKCYGWQCRSTIMHGLWLTLFKCFSPAGSPCFEENNCILKNWSTVVDVINSGQALEMYCIICITSEIWA